MTTFGGQSNRSTRLGERDPRTRRLLQELAQKDITIAPPLAMTRDGKLTVRPAKGLPDVNIGAVTDIGEAQAAILALQTQVNLLTQRLRDAGLLED